MGKINTLYDFLPGIYSEKVDGNLIIPPSPLKHVIAIFGTTESGPAYYPYYISDYSSTFSSFGHKGTAIQGVFEAMPGSPETIMLTRICATPTKIFLAGKTTITTRLFGPDAPEKYGLHLDKDDSFLRIYDISGTTNELVWSNDPADYDEVLTKSHMDVDIDDNLFTDISADLGTASTPLSFETIINNPTFDYCGITGVSGTEYEVPNSMDLYEGMLKGFLAAEASEVDQVVVPYAYLDKQNVVDDEKKQISEFDYSGTATADGTVTITLDGDDYTVTVSTGATALEVATQLAQLINDSASYDATHDSGKVTVDGGYGVPYTIASTSSTAGITVDTVTITQSVFENKYIEQRLNIIAQPAVDSTSTNLFYVVDNSSVKETASIKLSVPQSITATLNTFTATVNTNVTISLNGQLFTYAASTGEDQGTIATQLAALINADSMYTATATGAVITITGTTGVNEKAFSYTFLSDDPALTCVFAVITSSDSGATYIDPALYTVEKYNEKMFIVINDSSANIDTSVNDLYVDYIRMLEDALPYAKWEEVDGDIEVTWSPFRLSGYTEVNFAYDIARFAYELSANNNEALGVVAVKQPKGLSRKDITKWIGTLPEYNVDGVLTKDGTGLLGNKFMVGSSKGAPGFFATDDRTLEGLPLQDSDGAPVDIGKYLAVVVGWGLMQNSYKQKPYGYFGSPECTFAVQDEMLPPNIASTNKELNGFVVPYRLTQKELDRLTGAKYTVIAKRTTDNATIIVDSPTAATNTSDYRRRQTMKICKALIDDIREICMPFIGGPTSNTIRLSQEGLLKKRFKERQKQGWINYYDIKVTATPVQQVLNEEDVFFTIVPAFELKRIYNHCALTMPKS